MTPANGLPSTSVTATTNGAAKSVLMSVLCGEPLTMLTIAGVPAVLVSANTAGAAPPTMVALTLYGPPATPLAVALTLAWPALLVVADAATLADAPVLGAA